MGFGWLFLGYFAVQLMTLNPLGSVFRVIGYGIILMAALKLQKYQRAFGWLCISTILMLLVSFPLLISDSIDLLYRMLLMNIRPLSEGIKAVIGYVEQGLSFVFHATLLWGIYKIARETEIKKIADSSIRNFVFVCFYYLVVVIRYLPFESVRSCAPELTMIGWILFLTWMILNHVLIAKCYTKICDENDIEMNRKPSRFAFVNRMREELDRKEQKAREENEAYRRAKLEQKKKRKKK